MSWSLQDSKTVYGIGEDDLHFLEIGDDGQLVLTISGKSITMQEVIDRVKDQFPYTKRSPSFTLRMPQLITSQITKVLSSFDHHIEQFDYKGDFRPLYPIKVNQHKREVTAVLESSDRYGLEAGTKSELFLILNVFRQHKNRIIMCNGVKDLDYVQIVKKAINDGYRIYISIESLTELKHVINTIPNDQMSLFLRIKPYVSMNGYWGASSGRNSKFGLSIDDLNDVVALLKSKNLESTLKGIHAHPGSQVSNLYELSQYFKFMVKTYAQLLEDGFDDLENINFGGGLPIDYDDRLPNDNLQRYTKSMIRTITSILSGKNLKHPHIMIEAGRAITALSSMLVIQPLEFHRIFPETSENDLNQLMIKYPDLEMVQSVEDIIAVWQKWTKVPETLSLKDLEEYEKEIATVKTYLRKLFLEKQFTQNHLKRPVVKDLLSTDYFVLGNFSVFNGVCDFVLIGQYFPVFPIRELHKQPETLVRLVDITCDSDGEISIFRTKESDNDLRTKDGYPLTSKEPLEWKGFPIGDLSTILDTYIVIPLVGAYQDIIQFDHNLIGDLPDVEFIIQDGEIELKVVTQATNVQQLLKEVGYVLKNKDNPYISTEDES